MTVFQKNKRDLALGKEEGCMRELSQVETSQISGGGDQGGHVEPEKPKTESVSLKMSFFLAGSDGGHVEPDKPGN